MTFNKNIIQNYESFKNHEIIIFGDGRKTKAFGKGSVIILTYVDGKENILELHDVLYVPSLTCNLLSVRSIT